LQLVKVVHLFSEVLDPASLAQIANAKLAAVAFALNPAQDRNAVLRTMQRKTIHNLRIRLGAFSAELLAEPIDLGKKIIYSC
jgi:hypothetical protein